MHFDWMSYICAGSSRIRLDPVEFNCVCPIKASGIRLDPVQLCWFQSNTIGFSAIPLDHVPFDWFQCNHAGSNRIRLDRIQFDWTQCNLVLSNRIPLQLCWIWPIGSIGTRLDPVEFQCNGTGSIRRRLDPMQFDWFQCNCAGPVELDWTQCNLIGSSAVLLGGGQNCLS